MTTNEIPKATVKFRDGHEEESISVVLFSNCLFYVTTASGFYSPTKGFAIAKYHPELAVASISISGEISYSFDNCWLIDDNVEEIKVWFEEKKDKSTV